jgi:ceramide synthetase
MARAAAAPAAAASVLDQLLDFLARFKTAASPPLASYAQHLPIQYSRKLTVGKLQEFGFPEAKDLWDGVLIAVLLTFLRFVLEYAVLAPFGRWCMQHKYYKKVAQQPIPLIDATLRTNKLPMLHEKQKLASALFLNISDVDEYMRAWRNAEREGKSLHKFVEVAWKLLLHVGVTYWGLVYIFWVQPWAKDMTLCWSSYPFSAVPRVVFWYYMMELGIYIHEMIFLVLHEARRSDFVALLIHHIATLLLICGSYVFNYVPIGALVMVLHDLADAFLEIAKLFNYVTNVHKWAQVVTDFFFVSFAIVFSVTRCILYPTYILTNTLTVPQKFLYQGQGSVGVLNVFLCVLFCLHLFWASLIVKMAVKMIQHGEVTKDERSDDEGSYLEPSMVVSKSKDD